WPASVSENWRVVRFKSSAPSSSSSSRTYFDSSALERPILRAAAENPSASTTSMKARMRVSVSIVSSSAAAENLCGQCDELAVAARRPHERQAERCTVDAAQRNRDLRETEQPGDRGERQGAAAIALQLRLRRAFERRRRRLARQDKDHVVIEQRPEPLAEDASARPRPLDL